MVLIYTADGAMWFWWQGNQGMWLFKTPKYISTSAHQHKIKCVMM